mmetsp:Transcript_19725/g.46343  ORF Transcript_19725/g.46343 Transcript_19725/m.46343 type:complete len:524 (+) Transcript_19725:528-2099(+)
MGSASGGKVSSKPSADVLVRRRGSAQEARIACPVPALPAAPVSAAEPAACRAEGAAVAAGSSRAMASGICLAASARTNSSKALRLHASTVAPKLQPRQKRKREESVSSSCASVCRAGGNGGACSPSAAAAAAVAAAAAAEAAEAAKTSPEVRLLRGVPASTTAAACCACTAGGSSTASSLPLRPRALLFSRLRRMALPGWPSQPKKCADSERNNESTSVFSPSDSQPIGELQRLRTNHSDGGTSHSTNARSRCTTRGLSESTFGSSVRNHASTNGRQPSAAGSTNTMPHLETVAGEACERSAVSKSRFMRGDIATISPDTRQSFLLSSSTVFIDSIHAASTGPSNTSQNLSLVLSLAHLRNWVASTPSLHSCEARSNSPYNLPRETDLGLMMGVCTRKYALAAMPLLPLLLLISAPSGGIDESSATALDKRRPPKSWPPTAREPLLSPLPSSLEVRRSSRETRRTRPPSAPALEGHRPDARLPLPSLAYRNAGSAGTASASASCLAASAAASALERSSSASCA